MDATEAMAVVLREVGFADDAEMADTARRFVGLLEEFRGMKRCPSIGVCDHISQGAVAVRDMAFHSLCAHHLVPFFGSVSLAYLPGAKLGGLGGFARVVHHFARRPQLQERLAHQIADELVHQLKPEGVVVRVRARQMCMELRGAKTRAQVDAWAIRGDSPGLVSLL